MSTTTGYRIQPKRPINFMVCILLCVVLLVFGFALRRITYGAQLQQRSLQLSSAQLSANSNYNLSFTFASGGTLGSIRFQFCANDPIIDTPCTAPVGFDDSNAVLSTQSGETGFSILPSASTSNVLTLSRVPEPNMAQPASYELKNITNPSVIGSYYMRIQTYQSVDATGSSSDYGGLAFSIANTVNISAEVPPYLIFCTGLTISTYNCASANGDYIDFGDFTPTSASKAQSQILVATNAANGYDIIADGPTLTSGNNVISSLSTPDISHPGTSQFGINLRANVAPVVGSEPAGPGNGLPTTPYDAPNYYRFVPGDSIASVPDANDFRLFTVSYIVNVAKQQAPGVYASTITYTGVGNF